MERTVSRATIPVANMAKEYLNEIFPHLTAEQVQAIREGKPVPPSPDWKQPGDGSAAMRPAQDIRRDVYLERPYIDQILRYFAGQQNGPSVACILVFNQRERLKLARKAVNQFVAQRYQHKRLVIVNGSDQPITTVPHAAITEKKVDPHLTVGEMRTIGLREAAKTAAYIKPNWDDDDVYDPHLLAYQMRAVTGEPPQVLLLHNQLRISIATGTVYLHSDPAGIANTAIVSRASLGEACEFPADADNTEFVRNCANRTSMSVVNNAGFPFNMLHACVWHGNNFLPADLFMGEYADDAHHGRWYLAISETEHLKRVLATFGLNTNVSEPKPEVPA